jgi:endogenous inhibitor of DNA gyrase (YacG/DUF329 family)
MNKNLKVKCPQCAKEFLYYESVHRPFCSERCKMIDLGHWFEESYRVPDKNKDPSHTDKNNEQERQDQDGEPENYEQDFAENEDFDEGDYE